MYFFRLGMTLEVGGLVSELSRVAAVELLRLAREMRRSGAVVLGVDAQDRVGRGMLKWADRCEAMAGREARRLRLVGESSDDAVAGA